MNIDEARQHIGDRVLVGGTLRGYLVSVWEPPEGSRLTLTIVVLLDGCREVHFAPEHVTLDENGGLTIDEAWRHLGQNQVTYDSPDGKKTVGTMVKVGEEKVYVRFSRGEAPVACDPARLHLYLK